MAESSSPRSYSSDPTLWLYTSLSSGSSQIVTATSRLETILKANRIPFKALDVATDEKARMLWGRRAGKRKLPGLVKLGMVIGDIDEIEEWNEYGELKEQVGAEVAPRPAQAISSTTTPSTRTNTTASPVPAAPQVPTSGESIAAASNASKDIPATPKSSPAISFAPEKSKSKSQSGVGGAQASMSLAMRQLGQEAAARAKQNKTDSLAARKAQVTAAEKLDNSGPPGMPPPSGTTDAVSAAAPETAKADVVSKADSVPLTEGKDKIPPSASSHEIGNTDGTNDSAPTASKEQAPETTPETAPETVPETATGATAARAESPLTAPAEGPAAITEDTAPVIPSSRNSESAVSVSSLPIAVGKLAGSRNEITTHRGSSISSASKEEIKEIEEALKIPEEPEEEEENKEQSSLASKIMVESNSSSISKTADHDQHVKFTGERQGEEIDRVKEELSRDPKDHDRTESIIAEGSATQSKIPSSEDDKEEQTQQQAAADPAKAIESVED